MRTETVRRAFLGTMMALFVSASATAQQMCYPPITDEPVVFNELLQPSWFPWTYGSLAVLANDPANAENKVLKVQYTRNWGEYIIFRPTSKVWHTQGQVALIFRVRGIYNNCEKQVWVQLRDQYGQVYDSLPITEHMVTPPLQVTQECWGNQTTVGLYDPSKWYTVVIPISAFIDAANVTVKDIVFEGGWLANYGAGDLGTIYLDDIWWVEGLEFPLKRTGDGAYDTPISSALDHVDSNSKYNCRDEWVVAYTGEVGHSDNGSSDWSRTTTSDDSPSACVGQVLRGYAQDNNNGGHTPFSLNGQYDTDGVNQEEGNFLFYDGHSGYDYPATDGTPFYPVADGNVESASVGLIVVDHQNGYKSYYMHNSVVSIGAGKKVEAGVTKLGETGDNHLHFTLKLYGMRTDPYGWTGGFDDPSRAFVVNAPLWK